MEADDLWVEVLLHLLRPEQLTVYVWGLSNRCREPHCLLNGGYFIEFVPRPLNLYSFLLLTFVKNPLAVGRRSWTLNTCWTGQCLLLAHSQTQTGRELREEDVHQLTTSRSHRRPGNPGATPTWDHLDTWEQLYTAGTFKQWPMGQIHDNPL